MTRRALSLALAFGGAAFLFAAGCEKKPEQKGPGPAKPNIADTMTAPTMPTGPGKDPKKDEATKPSSPSKVSLESGSGDLGDADFGQKKKAEFLIRNTGAAPLELAVAAKSCICAGVEISTPVLLPGQAMKVFLVWAPKAEQFDAEGDVVRLWADLRSKDASATLRLEATGRLKPAVRLGLPRGRLDFGRFDLADLKGAGKETALEAYTLDPKRKGFSLKATCAAAGLMAETPTPLGADRLASLGAVSGWRVVVRAQPGLPAGRFRERLELATSAYSEPLALFVEGQAETGAVSMEPVQFELATARLSPKRGYRSAPVRVALRYEADRTLTVKAVEPPLFQAKATPGQANEWRVELSLLPESELRAKVPAALLEEYRTVGFADGWVACATNHSQVPELRIPISAGRLGE